MASVASAASRTPRPQREWTLEEELLLIHAVKKIGENSWVTVVRQLKSKVGDCDKELFSAKSCAAKYQKLLEQYAEPRKRRQDGGATAPNDKASEKLVARRVKVLKQSLKEHDIAIRKLKQEIIRINSGRYDDKLDVLLAKPVEEVKSVAIPVFLQRRGLQNKSVLGKRTADSADDRPAKRARLDGESTGAKMETTGETPEPFEEAPGRGSARRKSPAGVGKRGTKRKAEVEAAKKDSKKNEEEAEEEKSRGSARGRGGRKKGGSLAKGKGKSGKGKSSANVLRNQRGSQDKQVSKILLACLKRLKDHKCAWAFLKPVTKAEAADYDHIIFSRMDLSTMGKRIHDGHTATVEDFMRDFLLMVCNALVYNKPGDEVHELALEFKSFGKAEIDKIWEEAGGGGSRGRSWASPESDIGVPDTEVEAPEEEAAKKEDVVEEVPVQELGGEEEGGEEVEKEKEKEQDEDQGEEKDGGEEDEEEDDGEEEEDEDEEKGGKEKEKGADKKATSRRRSKVSAEEAKERRRRMIRSRLDEDSSPPAKRARTAATRSAAAPARSSARSQRKK